MGMCKLYTGFVSHRLGFYLFYICLIRVNTLKPAAQSHDALPTSCGGAEIRREFRSIKYVSITGPVLEVEPCSFLWNELNFPSMKIPGLPTESANFGLAPNQL